MGSALGMLAALLCAGQGILLLAHLDNATLRDDVQHRRREAGEGFYDTWPEDWT